MTLTELLAEERRARLAAERLLELKQQELRGANLKLRNHARRLSSKIHETRAEVEEVRDENNRVRLELGEANEKIELVEGQLWKSLETVRDGFAMYDTGNRLELANPSFLAMFDGLETVGPGASYGQILEAMVEEGIVDLQGENTREWQIRMFERWQKSPIPPETVRMWNGSFIKFQDRRTPEGGVVTLAVDITELMRMWSAVEELPDGFVMYDAEDRLLMCNQRYRDLYSKSAEAIRPGVLFEEILRFGLKNGQYSDATDREEEWLEARLEQHRLAKQELEQKLDDGSWLRVYERQTRDGGRVGLRVDITDIKQDQERLKDAMIRSEAASRTKSAFLANMSHEIRTPMNGVVGMADLMMDTDLSEEQRLYVDTIRGSGEALLVIINDILDYSKIEADKLELHPEPFDLERAVHEVILLLQPKAREQGIALLIDYDMFLPTRFIGDPGRFRQILTNMLGNAVKFTIEGHVLVRVVGFSPEDGPTAIHIIVEDTGIGIPPEKVDHVFGEFNQVEDERNRKFEGTGLGLAISRRLVELMGGEIWAESELGKGSCFGMRIELPTDEPINLLSARVPPHFTSALICDDHFANRTIIEKQLQLLGLKTWTCQSAADVLQADPTSFDVLVAEAALKDSAGPDLIAALRAAGSAQPVILLSDRPGDLQPVDGGAAHAVLQKPVGRRALFEALESLTPPEPATQIPDAEIVPHAQATPEPEADSPASQTPLEKPKEDIQHPNEASADAAWSEAATADKTPVDPPAQHETPTSEDTSGPPALPSVLLAEDNKTNQLVFRKMAAAFNIDLRIANNGIEAVSAYQEQRPDLIFMDISMPEMDGKEATAKIREIEGDGPQVPIVACTAHAMTGDEEMILKAGLTDYLTKPLRKAALADKVALYLPGAIQDKAG